MKLRLQHRTLPRLGFMPLLSAPNLRAQLILASTASGAPGGTVQSPTGVYNPVHELLGSFADAVTPIVEAAAALAVWTPLPTGVPYPGTIPIAVAAPGGPFAPPVKAIPSILPPTHLSLAHAQATTLGWIGTHRAVLFHGIYGGIWNALASAPSVLGSLAPLSATLLGSTFVYTAPPVVAETTAQAIIAAFLSNPRLGVAGDPSRRVILATEFARVLSTLWSSVTPTVIAGTVPAGPAPVVVPVAYFP